jgi:hypothetical protein
MSNIWVPNNFLGKVKTAEYVPRHYGGRTWQGFRRIPPFNLSTVEQMLTDPRIAFGLRLIKGPIRANAKFFIRTKNKSLREYLQENIGRFWMNASIRVLKSVEWGFSCSEVLYDVKDGDLMYDDIKDINPPDVKCETLNGRLVKANIRSMSQGVDGDMRPTSIYPPNMLWNTQEIEYNPYYGRSRLYGAYIPWLEKWSEGGFRDIRRLFYFKYSYFGGILYFPPGSTVLNDDGSGNGRIVDNMDLARELLEKMRTGATLTLPNRVEADGTKAWEYVPAASLGEPAGLVDYGDSLSDEEWEGMGIPPEVARAEGTGAYAGRLIPMQAYYSILQETLDAVMRDADQWVFNPLAVATFGEQEGNDYDIIPFSLWDVMEKKYGAESQPQPQAGQPQPGQGNPQQQPPAKKGEQYSLFSNEPPAGYLAERPDGRLTLNVGFSPEIVPCELVDEPKQLPANTV